MNAIVSKFKLIKNSKKLKWFSKKFFIKIDDKKINIYLTKKQILNWTLKFYNLKKCYEKIFLVLYAISKLQNRVKKYLKLFRNSEKIKKISF